MPCPKDLEGAGLQCSLIDCWPQEGEDLRKVLSMARTFDKQFWSTSDAQGGVEASQRGDAIDGHESAAIIRGSATDVKASGKPASTALAPQPQNVALPPAGLLVADKGPAASQGTDPSAIAVPQAAKENISTGQAKEIIPSAKGNITKAPNKTNYNDVSCLMACTSHQLVSTSSHE